MTPERWKCLVRKAPHRRPFLDSGSLSTFPQQRTGLWEPMKLTHNSTETDRDENNTGTVEDGDFYSILSEVVKESHAID